MTGARDGPASKREAAGEERPPLTPLSSALFVVRMLECALDEGLINREWLVGFAEGEASRAYLGGIGSSAGGNARSEKIHRAVDRLLDGERWRAHLEAARHDLRAGWVAMALLRRILAAEAIPDRVAELVAEGVDGVSPLGGLALLARLSTSEEQAARWMARLLDELPALGVGLEDRPAELGAEES